MVTYPPPSLSIPSTDPASPNTTAPSARRRGLSYLRNYTHTHLSQSSQEASASALASASTSTPRHNPRQNTLRSVSSPPLKQTSQSDSAAGALVASEGGLGRSVRADSDCTFPPGAGLATAHPALTTAFGGLSRLMARSRSGSAPNNTRGELEPAPSNLASFPLGQMPTIRLVPHQDSRSSRPSLSFTPTSRTLPHDDCVIRVGRYSERDSNPNPPPNVPSWAPVGFKSKVVSRRHCEFWCSNGQWYIKDVKSSSGTFLNHIRLSQPSTESKPWPVNDGDVVQLGIDFRGGEEMIFRCVKIRVECNRAWQKSLNNFNVTTHKRLRALGKAAKNDADTSSNHSSECSICLMSIAPCQSLFVAPCSHVWHYKCIRPILNDHKTWPQFLCPNCRAVADLEADVDDAEEEEWDDEGIEKDLDLNNVHKVETNGAPAERPKSSRVEELEKQARKFSRMLALRDSGISSSIPNLASPFSNSADQAVGSIPPSSTMYRRTTPRQDTQPSAVDPRPDAVGRGPPFPTHRRPSTPTRPPTRDEDTTPDGSPSGEADMLATDGPVTPTNHAGPFVFDGSGGTRGGAASALGAESAG